MRVMVNAYCISERWDGKVMPVKVHVHNTKLGTCTAYYPLSHTWDLCPADPDLWLSKFHFPYWFENCCKRQLNIFPTSWHALMQALHESSTLGHMKCFHTKAFLEWHYWWPKLSTFVNNFIAKCATSQQNKMNTHSFIPPLNLIPLWSTLPFKQIFVDLVTNLSSVLRSD